MKKCIMLAAFMVIAGLMSSCNTVEGIGRDVEKAGESIQNL